uniref:uncharacterized protein LOC124050932 isoform X2 n=1 Tax=Scatophagus argus TaxID=75038 RepID=UPI001ED82D06|nr:uncharacterized protein LOC124050932 isoform X2 [Scatophagus argus]
MRCTYTYPSRMNGLKTTVERTLWFTKIHGNFPTDLITDPQYSGRVQYKRYEKSCTLRITDLRESDSAEYKFRFITNKLNGRYTGSPGVILSVTDLQVQVRPSSFSSWADLTCHSSCRLPARPSYVWYKNGEKIETQTSSSYSGYFDDVNSYSCAVAGHEDSPSPPVCVRGQSCNKVTYADRRICAFKGSSVDISCTYNSYEAIRSKWWSSPGRCHQWQSPSQLDSQRRVQVLDEGGGRSTLRISDLRESDSAEYRFTFTAGSFKWGRSLPATTLTVTDVQVQVSRISVSQSYTEAELKCHSSCSPAARLSYVWFRNGTKISGVETSSYKDGFYVGDVVSCALKGHEDYVSASVLVQGQDGWAATYTPTEICALRGSTVDMRCTYTYPSSMNGLKTTVEKTYWFVKMNRNEPLDLTTDPQYSGRVDVQCGDNDCTLRITDLRESDSAEYKFMFITNQPGRRFSASPGVTLSVTDPDLQVQVRPSSSSTWAELTCHSSCHLPARPSFVWYKNGEKIETQTSSSYSGYFGYADSYSCAVAGHEDSPSPPVCVRGQSCNKVTYADRRICAFKGSSVDISCSYNSYEAIRSKWWSSPGRSLQWQSPSQLDSQHRVQVLDEGGGRSTLRISDLRESDSAEYRFTFTAGSFEWGRSLPATTLTVTDPDLQVQVRPSLFYIWAELTCHSSCRLPARPSYVWYRNGEKIQKQTSSSYSRYFDDVNSYSCAVAGHEDSPSPPVCVRGQSCNKVTYADRRICAFKGSSVDISCSYNSYEAIRSKLWFSPGRSLQWQSPSQLDSQRRVQVLDEGGGRSTLRISDLRESDSAEYRFTFTAGSFEWGRSLPATTLTVTDVQVQVSRISVSQSYTEAELKCHSSCSPAARLSYVWFRNGTKISGVETSSYKDGFYVGDVVSCALKGHEDYVSASVLVQGQDGWAATYTPTEICALRGSTVDMRCTYTYPSSMNGPKTTVRRTFWFARQDGNGPVDLTTDPQYSSRVDVQCGDNDCTLRITDLRESDSAEYKFRFITNQPAGLYSASPGVTLSVTDLQVQVRPSSYSTWAELTCHSSCRLPARPSFVWYKNGDKIETQTSSSYSVDFGDADSYSCAVAGHEDSPSPPVCVRGQSCNKVTYADRRICAVKGSSVDISCTYNSYYRYIRSKLWFSPGRSLQWQSPSQVDSQRRVQVLDEGGGRSTLRISDLRESDSAEYRFTFTAGSFEWGRSLPATTLTVTDPDLQVQVRPSSYSTWAELTCHSSCRLPARPSFVWYKNGEKIQKQTSSSYSGYFGDADSYSCAVAGHEDSPSRPVCVRGQSCNKVTYADRRICAFKGSSVDISCTYNSVVYPVKSKLWFSPGRSLQWQSPSQLDSQRRVQVLDEGGGRSTLRISDLRESDSAEYKFRFKSSQHHERFTGSPGVTLSVTDVQVKVSRSGVSQSSNSAELKCHSRCPRPKRLHYIWYKNGQKIEGQTSRLYSVSSGPADSFSCAVEGYEAFRSPPVLVQGQDGWAVTYTPTEICALRGSTVDMRCTYTYPSSMNGLKPTVEEATWFVKMNRNEPVDVETDPQYSGRVILQCGDNNCTLRITDLRESDSAEYKFMFKLSQHNERFTGSPGVTLSVTAHLDVQVKVSRSGVSQSSNSAELKCHSRCPRPERLHYIWYKNGQKIEGQTSRLYSVSSGPADSFSCAVEGYEAFRSPPVLVQGQDGWAVTYTPTEICALRGSTVDMRCTYTYPSSMNGLKPTIEEATWFVKMSRNEPVDLTTDPQYSGRVDVQCGDNDCTLRITDLRESDSAEYKFRFITNQPGGRYSGSPGVTLSVTDPDLQVQVRPSSSSTWAELTCHSSCRLPARPSFVWYKNGEKIQTQTSSSYSVYFGDADSYSCAVAGHEDSPSPPVCVRGQSCNKVTYADRRICAVKGSSVDIFCTYNSHESIRSKLWSSPGRSLQWQSPSQLDSQRRVQVLDEGGGRSTLRISDLRESDSAEYRFTFTAGSFEWGRSLPATTLTVTDVQVQVSRISVSQSYTEAELKCHSSCSPAARLSYVWFRNGTKISGVETSSYKDGFYVGDVVSCALKGHEDYVSASVLVQGQDGWAVTYTPTEICALRGSTVDMICTYTYPSSMNGLKTAVEETTWFVKMNRNEPVDLTTDPQYSGRVDVQCGDNNCTLRITDLRESDSAEYKFMFKLSQHNERFTGSPGVTLSVTAHLDVQVKVSRSGVSQSSNSAELKCHSRCPRPERLHYIWYKNGQKIEGQTSRLYSVSSGPADSFSCAVEGYEAFRSPPVCEFTSSLPLTHRLEEPLTFCTGP